MSAFLLPSPKVTISQTSRKRLRAMGGAHCSPDSTWQECPFDHLLEIRAKPREGTARVLAPPMHYPRQACTCMGLGYTHPPFLCL